MDLQSFHIVDFPPRLRLVKNGEIEAARVDLNQAYAEHVQREAVEADTRRDLSAAKIKRFVRGLCVAIMVFCVVYFGGQLLRGAF